MKKIISILLITGVFCFGSELSLSKKSNKPLTLNKQLTEHNLTIKELKNFNGKDGKKAFIAVDGVIYDVSNSKAWKNGMHKGKKAGEDVSDVINKSPHGKSVLNNLEIIGKIIKEISKD